MIAIILRALMIGVASALLADGWRGLIAGVLFVLAFHATDYLAERETWFGGAP